MLIKKQKNYLKKFTFHPDIEPFLYFADGIKKNYFYKKNILERLKIYIISGNLESGINIYSDEEPSALYTSFKIIKPPLWVKVAPVPHYPRYRALNPYQRFEYLTFLENPYKKSNIGYCYLLFYALERRLYEGQKEVIPIMQKLATSQGGKFQKSVYKTLWKYHLWEIDNLYPANEKVFSNYTLYVTCNVSAENCTTPD